MYALRYWYEQMQRDGRIVRLEIHQKDGTAPAMEIGPVVQALHLDIQGQTDDIDSPIVKTSLTMTFVDAPDHEEAGSKKCGEWMEFYTPDSTAWKVVLMVTDEDDRYYDIWSGFITPDSYSEQLRYRGSVTVIARDNIGHMQDFTFDWEDEAGHGMISLYSLIQGAWAKIESPMTLDIAGNGTLECDGNEAGFTYMNMSMFEGMSWYEAVEKALYSYGMVMRYVGRNRVQVSHLRYMPYFGKSDIAEVPTYVPVFEAFATRELAPAVKKVEETVEYDIEEAEQPMILSREFSGQQYDVNLSSGVLVKGLACGLNRTSAGYSKGWFNPTPSKTLAYDPTAFPMDEAIPISDRESIMDSTCVLSNVQGDDRSLSYCFFAHAENFDTVIDFGKSWMLYTPADASQDQFLGYPQLGGVSPNKMSVRYTVSVRYNGQDYYLYPYSNWIADTPFIHEDDTDSDELSIIIPMSGMFNGLQLVTINIIGIDSAENEVGGVCVTQITGVRIRKGDDVSLRQKNSVNTIYDEKNNVILSRKPEIGPAFDNVPLPGIIKNGIFVHGEEEGEFHPAREWNWANSGNGFGSEKMQLAVYNHLQLLCYHNRPNNVISGTIVNGDVTDPAVLWGWGAEDHILVSGSMNFLTGHIENAVLRSFMLYDDLWEGASFPETEESNTRN